jgi:hypothetical protein
MQVNSLSGRHQNQIIEPNFVAYSIETKDDLSYSGLILKRTPEEIVFKDRMPTPKRFASGRTT